MTEHGSEGIYLGTMSGTSMDGLDIVAVSFDEDEQPRLLAKRQIDYPSDLQDRLLSIAVDPDGKVAEMCRLDTWLGRFYANQITRFLEDSSITLDQVEAIGSHGQTIHHNIDAHLPATLQIGDPNQIAAVTGLTVVADFRRRDVALGGQGAPFAPAFHRHAFQDAQLHRVIINIGGIANITSLPANPAQPVLGYDTGPGNTFMDFVSRKNLGTPYDDLGSHARTGRVHKDQLHRLLTDEPYFSLAPPKSTGTDYFSPGWLRSTGLMDLSSEDLMATLTELTAITIAREIGNLDRAVDEAYVCGGGAHNLYLMERLECQLDGIPVATTAELGVDPDFVEAIAFAWLARQTLRRQPGNLPSVTNAEKFTILGAVYYA